MTVDSRFFEGRDYNESEFGEVFADLATDGVYGHAEQLLEVYAPGGLWVNVRAGRAMVQGFWYKQPTVIGLAIQFNSSGQVRYDRVVLRLERASNRVILAIRVGVPGSGGAPALQRAVGGDWEISLGYVRSNPNITNVTPDDVGDERSYPSSCGWVGARPILGGHLSVNGMKRFVAIAPDDPNTGIGSTYDDRMDFYVGTKPVLAMMPSLVQVGSYNATVQLTAGGPAGYGYERISVSPTAIFIGRDSSGSNTGPSQIEIGTSATARYIYIGQRNPESSALWSSVVLQGFLTWNAPLNSNVLFLMDGGDSTYIGTQMRGGAKEFHMILGTGPNQALGGSGDASIYTYGSGAGRLIFGTHGTARMWISPSYFAFGAQPARTNGYNFQQALNTAAHGIRLYHNNQGHHNDWYSDTYGRTVFAINDQPRVHIHGDGRMTLGAAPASNPDTSPNDQAALHIAASYGDQAMSGIVWTHGLGRTAMWQRSDGVFIFGPTTTGALTLWMHPTVSALTPPSDNTGNLGWPGYRFANIYAGNVNTANINCDTINGGAPNPPPPSLPTDPTFNSLTVNGASTLNGAVKVQALFSDAGSVRPTGNASHQLGQNGHSWKDLFTTKGWQPGGGSFNDTNCDDRMKYLDRLRPYEGGLSEVLQMRPSHYVTNGLYYTTDGEEFVGFRTSELLEFAPDMVGTHMVPRMPGEPEEEINYLNTTNLQYKLVNAIRELHERIEALEGRA